MEKLKQSARIVKMADNQIELEVCRESSCAECRAKTLCNSAGGEAGVGHKIVVDDDGRGRKVGDEVTVIVGQRTATVAVAVAYIIPVFMAIGLLLLLQSVEVSELTAGLSSLGVLALYFLAIKFWGKRFLNRELTIEIE